MRPGPALAVERRLVTELLYECGRSFRARIRDAPDAYPILPEGGAGLRHSQTFVLLYQAECLRARERQLPQGFPPEFPKQPGQKAFFHGKESALDKRSLRTTRRMRRCSESFSAHCRESQVPADPRPSRSEERRVGKECRSRWSAYQQMQK